MTLKTSEQTSSALRDIIRRAGIAPDVITSDQGQEFQGSFADFLKEKKIRQNVSRSYSPTENGLVERANQDIRKILRAFFVENKSLRWSNILHLVEKNKNETYNRNLKSTPNMVWSPDKIVPRLNSSKDEKSNPQAVAAKVLQRKKAEELMNQFKNEDSYEVGEEVRVKMSSLFSGVRKMLKTHQSKHLAVTYSPEIFKVHSVLVPRRKQLARRKYELLDHDGDVVTDKDDHARTFYAGELMRVTKGGRPMGFKKSLDLDRTEPTSNDLVVV
jgi:hypothetical protein